MPHPNHHHRRGVFLISFVFFCQIMTASGSSLDGKPAANASSNLHPIMTKLISRQWDSQNPEKKEPITCRPKARIARQ